MHFFLKIFHPNPSTWLPNYSMRYCCHCRRYGNAHR
ncbi:hypothetical protein Bhyg_12103 [Pseudolycoriella hygida]|uniref:Uncharacterized protein n=1 Tax=Pseudolycoriella hygida TaxID=35572 RepID=A0A9Q0MXK7_9DIPT|nr:hypothetical protein Bhyg_12103 [Pseudolycoriella hygida]